MGHIAIVAGIDKEHVYVAEASDEFVQVVLLDDLYKDDGGYTDMW